QALAARVVERLVGADAADLEIPRLRVREVEAAHGSGGDHGEGLRQPDLGPRLGLEQVEEGALLGVVGTGRIAGGRPDPAVAFPDEVVGAEALALAVAPFRARPLVEGLR